MIIGINIWHISFFITCWCSPFPRHQNSGNDEAEASSSTAMRTSNSHHDFFIAPQEVCVSTLHFGAETAVTAYR